MPAPTAARLSALAVLLGAAAVANHADQTTGRDNTMSRRAHGSFDVEITALEQRPHDDGITLARYSLDKRYHGALEATAAGEMLTAAGSVPGAAGYVAVERVDGTLDGRRGSFALQHLGRMSAAGQQLTILVVPGSGTGELAGIDGSLEIEIGAGGAHSYSFEYTLPAAP
jgi:hypothetical protein